MGNPLLAAGRLDRRVTIVRAGPTGRNSRNEEIAADIDVTTRSASVRPAPGTERFQSGENAALAPMRFVFRWEDGLVLDTDRLRHDGRLYDVKSVTEIGRREGIEVLATARGE